MHHLVIYYKQLLIKIIHNYTIRLFYVSLSKCIKRKSLKQNQNFNYIFQLINKKIIYG